MARSLLFRCSCPVCGRPLEIREEYAGRGMVCPHCGGHFTAHRQCRHAIVGARTGISLLERADRLLSISAARLLGATATATSS